MCVRQSISSRLTLGVTGTFSRLPCICQSLEHDVLFARARAHTTHPAPENCNAAQFLSSNPPQHIHKICKAQGPILRTTEHKPRGAKFTRFTNMR